MQVGHESSRLAEAPVRKTDTLANEMKDIRKARLRREVLVEPGMAMKLAKLEGTLTYNTNGNIVQAVTNDLGDV